ncbi:hypothetical protein L914_02017 [Phytophthora nicotianae]|uniref:Uncharacterized protein n=1 Tax=Phytophthora nicotianae TaxID=4792 RepID=W2P377_PHYNI|nr:hypothetical protein L914_02017 [Phytophthora nicotianae]
MAQRNPPAARVSAFASFLVRCVKVVKQSIATWEVQVDSDTDISTHNHETNKLIFDAYRGAKFISIPAHFRLELGLYDGYEDELFGYLPISVEAAWSVPVMNGNAGDDVLFVQDQMNITYVVAMQTSIQKKCFFQWDNTMSRRNDGNGERNQRY